MSNIGLVIKRQAPMRGTIMARCLVRQNPRKSVAPVRLAEAIGADVKTRHRPMTLVHFQCSKRDTNIIMGIHYQLHIRLNIHSRNKLVEFDRSQSLGKAEAAKYGFPDTHSLRPRTTRPPASLASDFERDVAADGSVAAALSRLSSLTRRWARRLSFTRTSRETEN